MSKRIVHNEEGITGIARAKEYAREHEKHRGMMYGPFLRDMKRLNVSGDCLEIGAGPGIFSALFAEENPDVRLTVTDLSPDMVSVAREYVSGKGIGDRLTFSICDAMDEKALGRLGKFDLVYSIYSIHHWKDLERCLLNLLKAVKDGGTLYLGDLKRVWWLYYLPFRNRDLEQVRASYTRGEIKRILKKLNITKYEIRTLFPYFLQSIIVKQTLSGF